MSSRARIGIVAAAVAALVVGFVIASGSGDDDKATTTANTATVAPAPAPAPADTTATETAATPPTTATTPAAPAIPTVRVVNAKPQGGVKRITFTKGDTIKFTVKSDTADEIHFHGYDVAKDVKAGGSVTFSVPATIEGRFEVELEGQGTQIAEVEVNPS
jgi:type IV secretory pathway VirB10-like protein